MAAIRDLMPAPYHWESLGGEGEVGPLIIQVPSVFDPSTQGPNLCSLKHVTLKTQSQSLKLIQPQLHLHYLASADQIASNTTSDCIVTTTRTVGYQKKEELRDGSHLQARKAGRARALQQSVFTIISTP